MTDDSEEVFRRAAEHYPLKTDNPDWELMLRKMRENPPEEEEAEPRRKKNYRGLWLLLLLLLPLAVMEWRHHFIFGSRPFSEKVAPAQNVSSHKTADENARANIRTDKDADPATHLSSENVVEASSAGPDISPSNNVQPAASSAPHAQRNSGTGNVNSLVARKVSSSSFSTKEKPAGKSTSKRENVHSQMAAKEEVENEPVVTRKTKSFTERQNIAVQVEAPELMNETDNIETKSSSEDGMISKTDQLNADSIQAVKEQPVIEEKEKAEVKKTPTVADTKKKQRRLYVGLLAGPDLSSIKLQKIDKTGFSYGFIAGFHVSESFDVEAVVFRDKKLYSSEGKYFSTKNLPLYPNTTISSVKGECKMWEVPLNVNFRFAKREKSNWLLAAGASGYFMENEYYVFDVNRYGMNYAYASDYKSHDRQLFAVINIAAAYTRKLGKIADLRIQPYVKLPVNKVGTGELPIQSAGLMIGLTKDLF